MKKLVSILLTCTLLMLSTTAFAIETKSANGFYDITDVEDVTVTFCKGKAEVDREITNANGEQEVWHPYSDKIIVNYTNAVKDKQYGAALVLGTGVPTRDDDIIFLDQIIADSNTVNFDVYPTLPESSSEMSLYILSSEEGFELINIPVKYAVNLSYSYTPGDINNDGAFDIKDALIALKIGVGTVKPTTGQRAAADLNSDGKCDAMDALNILQNMQ